MKCKQCKKRIGKDERIYRFGLSAFCSVDCATAYGLANREVGRKKIKKEKDKEFKIRKAKFYNNDLQHQLKLTEKSFNKMRKLQELKLFADQGREPECISCGKTKMDWCCGHLKTVGAHSELRFDEANTYLQCNVYCNMHLSGNINGNKNTRGFLQGLKDRFGEYKYEEIMEYLETKPDHKWTCEELIEMRKEFNAKIRELECTK